MLDVIFPPESRADGRAEMEDLIAHLPGAVRFPGDLNIAPGKSEYEILDYFKARGAENVCAGNGWASFLGAGVYHHYRPVMVDTVISHGDL
jgi:glycine dehydrogenase subunit 1